MSDTESSAKLGCGKSKADSPAHSISSSGSGRQAGGMSSGGRATLFPGAYSPQRAGNLSASALQSVSAQSLPGRGKVALAPGHSLMDWIRLGRSAQDLTGVGGRTVAVSPEELAKHNSQRDAWIALRGKVYNVTPYMDFHPGGVDELMRGAGQDATELFDDVHKWVNAESMLEKCLVGPFISGSPIRKGSTTSRGSKWSLNPNGSINFADLKPPSGPQPPSLDWFQNTKSVTIVVYTKWREMKSEFVIIDCQQNHLLITILLKDHAFHVHKDLEESVSDDYMVKVLESGKVEVMLQKAVLDKHWSGLGKNLERHNTFVKLKDRALTYRKCQLSSISQITHDTKLLKISWPQGTMMCVPVGYHIHIKHNISGVEVVRSYTVVLPSLSPDEQDQDVQQGKAVYLMVKIYPSGTLTPWLGSLANGDTLDVSDYSGNFAEKSLQECTHLLLLAAGTGFTPMIRLLYKTVVEKLPNIRKLKLFFFNKKQRDVLWNDQLQQLASGSSIFTWTSVLSEPDEGWSGPQGRIRAELLTDEIPTEEDGIKLLVCACGPTPFTKEALRLAKEQGAREGSLHAFLG